MKYVIDTHALIWFLEGNSRLGANAKAILSNPDSQLIIPATTLAEAIWIVERGRTSIPSAKDLISAVETDSRILIYPLDKEVIEMTVNLSTINEMHDRQITATALVLASKGDNVQLLTYDQNITASGVVTIVW
ncbi:twitching motility protein PilT [Nostoc linckia z18]|jgi:PIN domain nuclease of toxin-antitoxin system|uniref:Twitching motility protein PilT n=2 Tax=Nostoc linckia TaxID=92942 RepID=A0A9Q5Z8L8_NOSLI|nr:PIN domain-containing protein [Nostoc linckia]PHK39529.1 twitching motility protein PilT [Nostoc linckia z15]PHK46355.1 twitching motility protein PilT [Nostoc linckia z16]PHJ63573.1 twitching motility protein PilT [Nostoc linckia z3]PHJ65508.1 twitching motility protein PilT [Nostoc linckia z1]PHJ76991.1 twitching motility protein PilT [Nostoc linckia z2]